MPPVRHDARTKGGARVALLVAVVAATIGRDRARGCVVAFLNVGLGPLRTGVFNVADLAITMGAFIVVAGWGFGVRPPRLRPDLHTADER